MCLIGITPYRDDESKRLMLNRDYPDALRRAGAMPVILPWETDPKRLGTMLGRLDGLLLSGGEDIDPALYGEERLPLCGAFDLERDAMETALCRLALERDMPLLAICRGIQVLNVTLGGTLYQDVASQYGDTLRHSVYDRPREQVHSVRVLPGTRLSSVIGAERIRVNSRHHQAVKTPGRGLTVCAEAEDGLTEGVEMPGRRFTVGVQWHPESLSDYAPEAHALFAAFAEACTRYTEERK